MTFKTIRGSFQLTHLYIVIGGLIAICMFSMITKIAPAHASSTQIHSKSTAIEFSENDAIPCDENKNLGTIFYNFKALLIKFNSFPHVDVQKTENFPEFLKYENFKEQMAGILRRNFARCLGATTEKAKSIIFLSPPATMGTTDFTVEEALTDNTLVKTSRFKDSDMHDPDNLTIVVNVSYNYRASKDQGQLYGQISYFLYRPEVSYLDARIPGLFTSKMAVFFPTQGKEKVETALTNFLRGIRPIMAGPLEDNQYYKR